MTDATATRTEIHERGYAHPEALVSTEWVAAHLKDPAVRIIESNEDLLLYPSGHIPGAVQVDWTDDLNDPVRRDYLGRAEFEALMSRIGVTPETTRRVLRRQEQLVGLLRLLGLPALRPHQRPGDGRRARQVGAGGAAADPRGADVSAAPPMRRASATTRGSAPSATRCCATCRPGCRSWTCAARRSSRGERTHMPEYPQEGVLRGGHIPGAKSVPWARAANAGRHASRPPTSCGQIYEREQGLEPDDDIIAYCRIGERSQPHLVRAHLSARLPAGAQLRRLAGPNGATRWALPIEKP